MEHRLEQLWRRSARLVQTHAFASRSFSIFRLHLQGPGAYMFTSIDAIPSSALSFQGGARGKLHCPLSIPGRGALFYFRLLHEGAKVEKIRMNEHM